MRAWRKQLAHRRREIDSSRSNGWRPVPRAKRAQSSNLLIVNGRLILWTPGIAPPPACKMRFNFRTLSTIFITHGHNDHTGGLGMLLSAQWGAQRTQPVNVYGPPGTHG